MSVQTRTIDLKTKGSGDTIDITGQINLQLAQSGIKNGIVTIFVPGSTASVTTLEFEPGVLDDFRDALERAVPESMPYKHHLRWQDGNGHSHVRAAWLGPSLTVPFRDANLILGTWQQVVLIDFDNTSRQRRLILQILGE
ncbi:MAG TPA: secondary thiamine-phosphate synthase enzyme YjbQ [bacterium]|nr:secondary thiamine-phosphate synthase enzyme YjbQ [bacterium]